MAFLCIGVLHCCVALQKLPMPHSRARGSSNSSGNRSNSIPASKIHIKYEFIRRKICAYALCGVCCELCVVYTPRWPQFMHTSFASVYSHSHAKYICIYAALFFAAALHMANVCQECIDQDRQAAAVSEMRLTFINKHANYLTSKCPIRKDQVTVYDFNLIRLQLVLIIHAAQLKLLPKHIQLVSWPHIKYNA